MFGLFRSKPAMTASDAARVLAAARGQNERQRRRDLCDQLRAELYAKGRTDMTPIDWSAL